MKGVFGRKKFFCVSDSTHSTTRRRPCPARVSREYPGDESSGSSIGSEQTVQGKNFSGCKRSEPEKIFCATHPTHPTTRRRLCPARVSEGVPRRQVVRLPVGEKRSVPEKIFLCHTPDAPDDPTPPMPCIDFGGGAPATSRQVRRLERGNFPQQWPDHTKQEDKCWTIVQRCNRPIFFILASIKN